MAEDPRQPRPRGFGLFARIVYVHQAVCLAFFLLGLRVFPERGIDALVLPHLMGIAISIAVLVTMFGVAARKSLRALSWLRVILWIAVVKIFVIQLWLLAKGNIELTSYVHAMLVNELIAIPLAVYWSRSAPWNYLASFKRASR
ncbi:hypothetical protein KBY80_10170 [Synechococcus sp. JJ3a-Johnson]|uniref:hypothetical protein n=1 Tax=unclassified Synechococcus TaxID=2626047 RepID=UPI0020CD87AA|nr:MULTISPECIES: hypothetical protein [unclassified Synechococcus]MCP9831744.1 hypothetical protein [Synechococcus sp. JJ3a-Johnson]